MSNKRKNTFLSTWLKTSRTNVKDSHDAHDQGEDSGSKENRGQVEENEDQENGMLEKAGQENELQEKGGSDEDNGNTNDITEYVNQSANDDIKWYFIVNRTPSSDFRFPLTQYKDSRCTAGVLNRTCNREWFKTFEFLYYSVKSDGVFCLACLFPDSSHRRPKKLITEPYRNWKHATSDLKSHATCDYHKNSLAKFISFKQTYKDSSLRLDMRMHANMKTQVETNRMILSSIIKSLIFCGRQGIALRGHRDDDTSSSFNKGNFKELLNLRIDSGDITLDHLKSCKKNAKYTSKTAQNDLLLCIKEYIQQTVIKEIKTQPCGAFYGVQCDEVTDSSNWEQLGIVLRYIKNNQPVEKLIEFAQCEKITGNALCQTLTKCLNQLGLDINLCRSIGLDGAANMSGKQMGCAALFKQQAPKAIYNYCASHDLNLALCKACNVKEVQVTLDAIKQLGLFFKYSPKRCRKLESVIQECNNEIPSSEKMSNKSKLSLFCETRWVEKYKTLIDFDDLYESLVVCLDKIYTESNCWDSKTITEAYGLMKKITDYTFIVTFQTVIHLLGYTKSLSSKLQGPSQDIIQAHQCVNEVKTSLDGCRKDDSEFDSVWVKCLKMAKLANVNSLEPPRRCGRQTQRNNVEAENSLNILNVQFFSHFWIHSFSNLV